jgi:hypothetical protein
MSKRRRGPSDNITGGTGDYNPQYYTMSLLQTAADTSTTAAFPLPVPRFQGSGRSDRSTIMEILKVYFIWDDFTAVAAQSAYNCFLTTSNSDGASSAEVFSGGSLIAWSSIDGIFATQVGFQLNNRTTSIDLMDGAGHGFLVATDNVYLSVRTTATGRANTVYTRLLYRLKDVTLQEYIGIVQGQQSAQA